MTKDEEEFRLNLIRRILADATKAKALQEARHSKGGGKKGGEGAKGQENEGDAHPINVARKAAGLGFAVPLHHHNGDKTHIHPEMGKSILDKYASHSKPHDKEEMVSHLWASSRHLHGYMSGNKVKDQVKTGPWKPGDPIPEKTKKRLKKVGL